MPGTIELELDDDACRELHRLSREHDIPQTRVLIQALRLYSMHDKRISDGESCTYSGDAKRAAEFAGTL